METTDKITKICVNGSRTFTDYPYLDDILCDILIDYAKYTPHLILGGAKGADTLAQEFAERYNIDFTLYKANWETHGDAAGFIRNREMIEEADILISFWDGNSKGTKDTIDKALKKGIETHVFIF